MIQDNYSDSSLVPPDTRQESVIIENFYSGNECNAIVKLEPVEEQLVVLNECNRAVDYPQGSENCGCVSIPNKKERSDENDLGEKSVPLMMFCNSYMGDNINGEAGLKSCEKMVRISQENECIAISYMPEIKQECGLLENVGDVCIEGVITHNVVYRDSPDILMDINIGKEFEGEENVLMLTDDYDITIKEEFKKEENGLKLTENHEILVQKYIPSVQVFQVIEKGDKMEIENGGFPLLQNVSALHCSGTIEDTSCLQKNGDILFVSDSSNASTQQSTSPKAEDFNGNYIASILRDQKIVTHEPFECQFCGKQFRVKEHLKVHLLCHPEYTPFMCEHCGESFQTEKRLAAHQLLHLVNEEYHCPNCGNIICRKEYFSTNKVHNGEKLYQCRNCCKVFSLNGNIIKHKKVNGETQCCCKIFKTEKKFFRPRILRQMPR